MKLVVTPLASVSSDQVQRNEAHARTLGFPRLGRAERPRLAVVGGGPSIKGRLEEIRAFDGEIWAINGAWKWLNERGVDARFFSFDPSFDAVQFCVGARKAMLGLCCHPNMFELLKDADVEVVHIGGNGMHNGPTTAASAPLVALERGHMPIVFYGCESSYAETTHVYGDFNLENLLRVRCNGEEFLTSPDMLSQATHLGAIMSVAPQIFHDCSGGLLSAVMKDPEIDVLAGSKSLHAEIVANHEMGVEEIMSKQHRDCLGKAGA